MSMTGQINITIRGTYHETKVVFALALKNSNTMGRYGTVFSLHKSPSCNKSCIFTPGSKLEEVLKGLR